MANYESAGSIISDAAAELGLGTVTDAYGSTDANVIQLRTLLKSAGRKMVFDRDWTHLVKEYSFVTRPNWAASTAYTSTAASWVSSTPYAVGAYVQNSSFGGSGLYVCTAAGTSSNGFASQGQGPISTGTAIVDGTVTWRFLNTGPASIVVKGLNAFTCTTSGTSGTVGPYVTNQISADGSVIWTPLGNAADYPLPSDFSNMIDQTGWNRTSRLPMGGPLEPQEWQYLKGRQQGVVFNVLFRPIANLLRLYPDTDPPGGYNVVFEYVSNSWVGPAGGTVPTTNAPTANSDLIYFDSLLMMRKLKLDWLKAKGFDTSHAQDQFDQALEEAMNADGSSAVLNLAGRKAWGPLVGIQNVPITGYGS